MDDDLTAYDVILPGASEIERRLGEMHGELWLVTRIYPVIADALAGCELDARGVANRFLMTCAGNHEILPGLALFGLKPADVLAAILTPDSPEAANAAAAWVNRALPAT